MSSVVSFHPLVVGLALGIFAATLGCASDPPEQSAVSARPPAGAPAPVAGAAAMPTMAAPTNAAAAGSAAGSTRPAVSAGSAGAPAARDPSSPQNPGSSSGGAGNPAQPATPGFVSHHGALHVDGEHIVDASGQTLQLRGMSLFWSQWSNYYVDSTVDELAADWNATVVRAALGVENGGYLESPADNEAKVVTIADAAIARDMYVIIDWHDHHAHEHQAAAVDFFTRMAARYGSDPHVIFEIYNEPLDVPWSTVKAYAQAVLAPIRSAGAKNLVIVGTPKWSQDVDVAATDPITDYEDVAYTLHFYAATHKQFLRDKATQAINAKLPLFVTEWGTCNSSGNGAVNQAETQTWLDFLSQHQISWANWALNDKDEACSALRPGVGLQGPWRDSALTTSGALVKAAIP